LALNEQRLRFVLTSPSGPVGRHLANKGIQAESAAKALATAEGLVRSGGYRSSIKWRLLQPLAVEVLADAPQSRIIERGSEAHTIRARTAGALWWDPKPNQRPEWMEHPDHGRPVPSVAHPGTRPYAILNRAVRAVFAR
jgi:hypothetical protein